MSVCDICLDDTAVCWDCGSGHLTCADCLDGYLLNHLQDTGLATAPIRCPGFSDGQRCKTHIDDTDALAHTLPSLPSETLQRAACHVERLRQPRRFVECPVCHHNVRRKKSRGSKSRLTCPTCTTEFCLKHGLDHSGMACPDDHVSVMGAIRSGTWRMLHTRTCPQCHSAIEKNGGCNHVTCRCGFEICWKCGKPWERSGGRYGHEFELFPHPRDFRDCCNDSKQWALRVGVVCAAIPVAAVAIAAVPLAAGAVALQGLGRRLRRVRRHNADEVWIPETDPGRLSVESMRGDPDDVGLEADVTPHLLAIQNETNPEKRERLIQWLIGMYDLVQERPEDGMLRTGNYDGTAARSTVRAYDDDDEHDVHPVVPETPSDISSASDDLSIGQPRRDQANLAFSDRWMAFFDDKADTPSVVDAADDAPDVGNDAPRRASSASLKSASLALWSGIEASAHRRRRNSSDNVIDTTSSKHRSTAAMQNKSQLVTPSKPVKPLRRSLARRNGVRHRARRGALTVTPSMQQLLNLPEKRGLDADADQQYVLATV